jgi:protease-4
MPSFLHVLRRCCLAGLLSLSLSGCVFVTGSFNPFTSKPEPLEEHVVSGEGSAKVLLIDISRTIGSQEEEGTLGVKHRESTTARVREELDQAAKDDHVRAVVLRINSPGGTVTGSDIVFHQLMDFKAKRHVPVVAQFLDMATSGAYYVALAADEIVASPMSVTGSVGVVMYNVNLSGLMEKIGVANQTIRAGAHKDIGSPLRKMTPEEERILQEVINQMQDHFLALVRERRPGLTDDAVKTIADGRVLTADQALQLGLIDRIGYLQETIEDAERRAGTTRARVITYRRPDEFAENIYSGAAVAPAQMNLINFDFGGWGHAGPQFLYMWLPNVE